MRAVSHLSRPPGRYGLDWMMITVALIAALLVTAAVVRTETFAPETRFGSFARGVQTLSETETLVAFETYDFNVAGWSDAPHNAAFTGLGGIVGPFTLNDTVSRDIDLPEGSTRAVIRLSLVAIDDWQLEGMTLSLNGAPLLTHRFSSRPALQADTGIVVTAPETVTVWAAPQGPAQERGFASGGAAEAENLLDIRIAIDAPADQLTLTLTPVPALGSVAATSAPPLWALDNLVVVAERRS